MAHNSKRELGNKRNPPKTSDATESPLTSWPQGVLPSAHINKLMIIAKEENHTQTHKKQEG